MKYEHLKSVSYQSAEEYEKLYNSRFSSDEAVHIDLLIHSSLAFFLRTPDLYEQIINCYYIRVFVKHNITFP